MSASPLTCAECGERIVRGRAPGTFSHVSRLVAACDLNSDHPAEPDWDAVGRMPCRACGEPVVRAGGAFTHLDTRRDTDHEPDPRLPVA